MLGFYQSPKHRFLQQRKSGEFRNRGVGKDRWKREMSEKSYIKDSRRRFIIGISLFVAAMLAMPVLIYLLLPSS